MDKIKKRRPNVRDRETFEYIKRLPAGEHKIIVEENVVNPNFLLGLAPLKIEGSMSIKSGNKNYIIVQSR